MSALRHIKPAVRRFHPEKSQAGGLRLVENFVRLCRDARGAAQEMGA